MNDGKHGPVQGLGYGLCVGWFKFFPNAGSDPSLTAIVGPLKRWVSSITYGATGVYTIVFKAGFSFANSPVFVTHHTIAALANAYSVIQIGAYNATTRTLVLQTYGDVNGDGTLAGIEVAADAGNSINVFCFAADTQGK
jgi:hypothetical protein